MTELDPPVGNVAMAFGTPIASHPWPDSETLNEELRRVILDVERSSPGISRSNVGGWHSDTDMLAWDFDCIRTLRERIRTFTIDYTRRVTVSPDGGTRSFNFRVDAWANVTRTGHYNGVHNHPRSLWSGVYYVADGDPDPDVPMNGKLELLDPRTGVNMIRIEKTLLEARYVVDAQPGLMLMFPSWLNHFVHPFSGARERISVSFNILIAEKKREGSEAASTALDPDNA